jgi:hypothetical protein
MEVEGEAVFRARLSVTGIGVLMRKTIPKRGKNYIWLLLVLPLSAVGTTDRILMVLLNSCL